MDKFLSLDGWRILILNNLDLNKLKSKKQKFVNARSTEHLDMDDLKANTHRLKAILIPWVSQGLRENGRFVLCVFREGWWSEKCEILSIDRLTEAGNFSLISGHPYPHE